MFSLTQLQSKYGYTRKEPVSLVCSILYLFLERNPQLVSNVNYQLKISPYTKKTSF